MSSCQNWPFERRALPTFDDLVSALESADLVVVENLTSLPLNVAARDALYRVLEGRRALFDITTSPGSGRHRSTTRRPATARTGVTSRSTISRVASSPNAASSAVTMRNTFDCDPPIGRRKLARRAARWRTTIPSCSFRHGRFLEKTSPARSARRITRRCPLAPRTTRGRVRRGAVRARGEQSRPRRLRTFRRSRHPRRLRRGRPRRRALDVGGLRQSRAGIGDPPQAARRLSLSRARRDRRLRVSFFRFRRCRPHEFLRQGTRRKTAGANCVHCPRALQYR